MQIPSYRWRKQGRGAEFVQGHRAGKSQVFAPHHIEAPSGVLFPLCLLLLLMCPFIGIMR